MKTKFDIKIVFKDATETIVEDNCSEYGTNQGGSVFYFVRKREVLDMGTNELIRFINMDKIDFIDIIRKNTFETKKERLQFIKSGGMSQ